MSVERKLSKKPSPEVGLMVGNEASIVLASHCAFINDPKDSANRDFGNLFRKSVGDSDALVREKALDALIAYLKAADAADAGRLYAKEVIDAIAANCLAGRTQTVEKAHAAFMLWIELGAVEDFLVVMEEKAIKNKVAKAVVAAIDVMLQALREFGSEIIPPKRILKMLPQLFDHQDQNVRASSIRLTLELCRWIGKDPVVESLLQLEKMQYNTMKKELEGELVNVTGVAKPTRKLRSEQDKDPEPKHTFKVVGASPTEEPNDAAPGEIDECQFVDPVQISGFLDGVKSPQWSERKEAVAELTKLSLTKEIAPGDISEVSQTLEKLATDVNIDVAVEAMKAICYLAKGLRNHFAVDILVKDADRLVSCLANKVAMTFDICLTGASSRSCKIVLNTLMLVFLNRRLASTVKESTLESLMTELLLWLSDKRFPQMDDGSQLRKGLEALVLKILANADRTSSFVVLINLLRPLDPARWPSPASDESVAFRNKEFFYLVIQYLVKIVNVLPSTLNDIDSARVLHRIHTYMKQQHDAAPSLSLSCQIPQFASPAITRAFLSKAYGLESAARWEEAGHASIVAEIIPIDAPSLLLNKAFTRDVEQVVKRAVEEAGEVALPRGNQGGRGAKSCCRQGCHVLLGKEQVS